MMKLFDRPFSRRSGSLRPPVKWFLLGLFSPFIAVWLIIVWLLYLLEVAMFREAGRRDHLQ